MDFRLTLPVFIHDQGCSGKMDRFGGMYCCLGGLIGPSVVPECLYGVPGEGWGWGGWVGGLTFNFRPTLPIVTHDQGNLGKMDCFRGMYCCLGGLMGPPVVPECYGVPGEEWGWGGFFFSVSTQFISTLG